LASAFAKIACDYFPNRLERVVIPVSVDPYRPDPIWHNEIGFDFIPTLPHFEKYPTVRNVVRLVMKSAGMFTAGQ